MQLHGAQDAVHASELHDLGLVVLPHGETRQGAQAILLHLHGEGVPDHRVEHQLDAVAGHDLGLGLARAGQRHECNAPRCLHNGGVGVLRHRLGYGVDAPSQRDLLYIARVARRHIGKCGSASLLQVLHLLMRLHGLGHLGRATHGHDHLARRLVIVSNKRLEDSQAERLQCRPSMIHLQQLQRGVGGLAGRRGRRGRPLRDLRCRDQLLEARAADRGVEANEVDPVSIVLERVGDVAVGIR
mmetsp:Transcript_74010/g.190973  ORF Transcript_74010/g.190973 Transcript_74010/m.190973 type:complete len:242 (+) Transcript_74010:468-1193(+)